MPTSRFSVATTYSPKSGDYICLPFANGKTALFPESLAPVAKPVTAAAAGAAKTLHAGALGKATVLVKSIRLDKPHHTPECAARMMVSAALAAAKVEGCKRIVVLLDGAKGEICRAVQEGALLGGYVFDSYLKDKARPLPVVLVAPKMNAATKKELKRASDVFVCVNFARDVMNEPPNVIHPVSLAKRFQKEGKAHGLKITVWDEKRLAKERCGGILGVGQGSASKPRLVIGEYNPRGAKAHIALVGKGVTFDTGGYCLKPGASQVGMKYDMGGAAMMFGAACAMARLKLPVRVTVLTPLAENDIDAEAYLTTSVLTTRSGRTVQVDNTDAEGRLILADALTVAAEKKPDYLLDAATLTGACIVGLGEDIAGVYGTDRKFTNALLAAGEAAGEYLWELPLHKPYLEQLKCTIADGKNIGSRWGGSVTAALFLSQWVPEGQRWTHFDIAGPGTKEEPLEHLGKGAKGFGVKTLVQWAETLV